MLCTVHVVGFFLCLSCVALLKIRQNKNYLKEVVKNCFTLKSEYLGNHMEIRKLQKTKILHMKMQ